MELPEGYRPEIIEGAIEVSPTRRYSHGQIVFMLRETLAEFLKDGDFAARNDTNVIHENRAWVPDLFVVAKDPERYVTDDGLGLTAAAVRVVFEVASPGKRSLDRDRVRKRREYARAGIPVYVIIDDYDGQGAVTLFSPAPAPTRPTGRTSTGSPTAPRSPFPRGPPRGW
ncbi:Uma2 family endonuclease [Streptomyces sp. NPDC090088]|uniref:Uma2 family endonuclease n=1 Tax=Streptomyces sp. NPDC090088 TaxID=3365944 RepID=UPI0037FE7DC2